MPNDSTDRATLARGLPISPPDDDDTLTDDEVTNERLTFPSRYGLCVDCAHEAGKEVGAVEGYDYCHTCLTEALDPDLVAAHLTEGLTLVSGRGSRPVQVWALVYEVRRMQAAMRRVA
jgi:hypothetical protein